MSKYGSSIYKRKDGRWEGRYVVGCKLISDHSPVLNLAAVPFFVKLRNSEIEQF